MTAGEGEARSFSVDEAWTWYEQTKRQLRFFSRLGRKYWDGLPWDGSIGKDDRFKELTSVTIVEETEFSLQHLDDFAIAIIYAAFEAATRRRVIEEIDRERLPIAPGIAATFLDSTRLTIEDGTLASSRVLELLRDRIPESLFSDVSQVRDYRNWVAHGRGGRKRIGLDPETAFARVRDFLEHLAQPAQHETVAEDVNDLPTSSAPHPE